MQRMCGVAAASNVGEEKSPSLRLDWDVEFSRFFNYPTRTDKTPANLRQLPKRKIRKAGGTWMVSKFPAVLVVDKEEDYDKHVLSVAVQGKIHEEHFVCSLSFLWPQVSCVPPCPIRGSRVVFMSYRDCSGQVQKFAVRFPTSQDAEVFLDFVKERFRDTTNISTVQNDFVSENSSPSELNASDRIYHRFDEESNCEEPTATLYQEMPALSYHQDQLKSPIQPVFAKSIETIFSGLPPSFTDFLNSCTTGTENAIPHKESVPTVGCASQNQGHLLNPSAKDAAASKQPDSISDVDLKTQIAKYMSDENFHDMLSKIERVINEFGGDMLLDG